MLEKVYLDQAGITYIADELSQGGELSQRLLWLNLEKGFAFTYVPVGVSLSSISDYSESLEFLVGGKVAQDFEEIAIQIITEYLDRNVENVALFETFWRLNDAIVAKRDHQIILINSTVYDFITGSDLTKPVTEYLQGAKNYPMVITLSRRILSEDFLPKSKLDEDALERLFGDVEFIIVGAFDGEGFLFWSKVKNM